MEHHTPMTPPPPPRLYSVDQVVEMTGISRAKLYEELSSGRLRSLKLGRRRLVPHDELTGFVARLLTRTEEAGW